MDKKQTLHNEPEGKILGEYFMPFTLNFSKEVVCYGYPVFMSAPEQPSQVSLQPLCLGDVYRAGSGGHNCPPACF